MNVTVDGIIYESQSLGGISRVYDEILPRMCEQDQTLVISLLTSGSSKRQLPVHRQIVHQRLPPIDDLLRPKLLWGVKRFRVRSYWHHLVANADRAGTWHSTNFTLPYKWKGPVVLSVYDMIHERFAEEFFNTSLHADLRAYRRTCLARADVITSISEATKRDLEEYALVDPGRVRVIYLAASPIFRRLVPSANSFSASASKPFLLYVGSRASYKNFERLLSAFAAWRRSRDFQLVAVGQQWTTTEMELLSEMKLDQQVVLRTRASDEELCELYNSASALVFPSLYEGFGIPLVEAMACGCPIAASSIPTTAEIANSVPVYFDPGDTDSLRCALDRVVEEGRNSERTERGFSRASEFSWERAAAETLSVYRSA